MKRRSVNILAALLAFAVGVAGAGFWELDGWLVRNIALSFLLPSLGLGVAIPTIKIVHKSSVKTLVSFVLLGCSCALVCVGFLIFFFTLVELMWPGF